MIINNSFIVNVEQKNKIGSKVKKTKKTMLMINELGSTVRYLGGLAKSGNSVSGNSVPGKGLVPPVQLSTHCWHM